MAYQDENDKLKDPNAQQDPNQQQQLGSSGPTIVNQGSNAVGTGVSTAGVGAGGTGKWTNIQAYLDANKNVDTGAEKMLNENVGGQFDKEKSDIQSESDKLKADAANAYKPVDDVAKNSQNYLDQAAKSYSWEGNQGDAYNNALGAFKNAMGAKYTGPTSYAHDISGKSQEYAGSLGSDESFNKFLGDMYQNKAGGQLSSGGRALQSQLNISNEPLAQARQNLLKKYSDLGSYRDQTAKDTNSALSNTANQFAQGQNAIRDFLGNKSAEYGTSIGKQESDAKSAYDKAYKNDQSGRSAYAYGPISVANNAPAYARGAGLTWQQLDQINAGPKGAPIKDWDGFQAMQKFYSDQDKKYADTALQDKQYFNAIQDLLGSNDKKGRKFTVRG